ncbi:MAG: glycoside hydrolase family 92 protein [Armatimonadetes bacterium]|nr:glycoside hydrolase family 92 protein [Akkermansiaceae bacterium]
MKLGNLGIALLWSTQTQWVAAEVSHVNPMIGTAAHGHTFPGATVPFGRVQLSPDTHNKGWDWCSGYHYSDSSIMGFSHTHLSGTGRGELLDILIMPTTGPVQFEPGSREDPDTGYRSRFSHETEVAKAGYYSVMLDDYKIKAEMTTTTRAGFHRYTFGKDQPANLVIDLAHSFATDTILHGNVRIVDDTLVVGSHKSKGWGEGNEKDFVEHEVFFAAQLSQPIRGVSFSVDGKIIGDAREADGKSVKTALLFDIQQQKPLLVKVGISEVDVEGAMRNVESEIPDWDFESTRSRAAEAWGSVLRNFELDDTNVANKETFYTALYHSCVAPFTASDVDGRYMGFDRKIHKAEGFTMLTGLSLWDTFRAANPLYTIISPTKVTDLINSMLAQYDQSGMLPVWSLGNSETNCMIGYHSIPIIADAHLKGIGGFDVEKAFQAMKKSAMQDEFDLKFLKQYNYIPRDLAPTLSVARTLEYAFDDDCIAMMADRLGKTEDHRYFARRAKSFENLFDTSIGFMRGKDSKGVFRADFDPHNAVNASSDFIEGNSWQYTWFVPHRIDSLIAGMGGKTGFVNKLDTLFSVSSKLDKDTPVDVTGLIGQYAHGNEPSHHVAYLFNYGDAPWKTQERVRQIMDTLYSSKPDGLCGNEDMGQMSAWYVFSALGFYPVNPADGRYVFGTPRFKGVSIKLPNGKKFSIKADQVSAKNIYIQKALLNGMECAVGYVTHAQILAGGTLEFMMGDKPGCVFSMQ